MVLAELGQKITAALAKLNRASVIDEKILQEILNEIASALMNADVNIKFVAKLQSSVRLPQMTAIVRLIGLANEEGLGMVVHTPLM